MIWNPSTLSRLSAPGFNRAIGMGDVVPYWGQQPNQTDSNAGEAKQGVSYDPNAGGGPTGSPGGGDSALNNLSALTPILNQIIAQQQAGAIRSGQGNAQANPLEGAVPGSSSQSMAQQIADSAGGVPIAGSGGVPGIAAAAPAPFASAAPVATFAAPGEGAPGDAAGGPGAGPGDGPGAPGSPGDASGGPAGGPGDGGGAGGGGGGATVICTELCRQGYLDENVWIADAAFGQMQSQATRDGYRLWATPVARGMARSRVLTVVVASLAIPWAVEMAHQMGVRDRGSLLGRAIMVIGLPLCTFLGGLSTTGAHA